MFLKRKHFPLLLTPSFAVSALQCSCNKKLFAFFFISLQFKLKKSFDQWFMCICNANFESLVDFFSWIRPSVRSQAMKAFYFQLVSVLRSCNFYLQIMRYSSEGSAKSFSIKTSTFYQERFRLQLMVRLHGNLAKQRFSRDFAFAYN